MQTIVNSKGQILIPAQIRRELGIQPGTYIHVEVNASGQIALTPVTSAFVRSVRGRYKGMGLMKALMEKKRFEKESA